MSEAVSYWNTVYGSAKSAPLIPSQFAAFIAQELSPGATIIDVGCGNGRDTLFFASLGHSVIGLDASEMAIARCREEAARMGQAAKFAQQDVGSDEFPIALSEHIGGTAKAVIYSRFFLHAIPEDAEDVLLAGVGASLGSGGMLAVEFRTDRDAALAKATAAHYRRFVHPPTLFAKAGRVGLRVAYTVEGFGFAKYRNDDAHVCRAILVKD